MSSKSDCIVMAGMKMPEEVIDAAANGRLVIFAGAGVSMQPPENLGNFEELTDDLFRHIDVADRVADDRNPPCEARLEKLVAEYGNKVYDSCADLMSKNIPSSLHKNILKCFDGHPIRIVTTNFDEKFESAAKELGIALEGPNRIYYSPALPLGDHFSGLVHLHGAVCRPLEMILTASDFGKAYVTKAWASRFLVDLFNTYTVIFVGYSLNDILVRYIARSISADSKSHLFVLVKRDESTREVESLGMTAVSFSKYEDLPEIFADISRRISYSLFDKMETIGAVAAQPNQSTPADWRDAIRFLTEAPEDSQAAIAKAYADGAASFDAVRSLVKHGIDGFLFANSHTRFSLVLAQWVAASFALTEPLSLLQLSTEQGKRFSGAFMVQVLRVLSNPPDKLDDNAYENSLAIWALQLDLLAPQTQSAGLYIAEILNRCTSPQIGIAFLHKLFEAHPSAHMSSMASEPDLLELTFTYDGFLPELTEYEDSIIRLLRPTAMQGFPIFVTILEQCHDLISAYETLDCFFDSLCFGRAAIEEHEQNYKDQSSAPDSLIDITRDIGLNVIDTENADRAIELCLNSRSNLAKRIGIFLLSKHNPNPNDAIDTVISRRLIDNLKLHHETYGLLLNVYPQADAKHQSALISYILESYPDLTNENDAYGRFNIFSWLTREAPTDQQLQGRIQEVLLRYPRFKSRKYPDLLSYITVESSNELKTKIPGSDFTAKHILRDYAIATEGNSGFALVDLSNNLRSAMANYPSQGIAITEELFEETSTPPKLLETLVGSIRWDKLDSNLVSQALKLILRMTDERNLFLQILSSLRLLFSENAIDHDALVDYYFELLDACVKHWDWLRDGCNSDERAGTSPDWMGSFRNSLAFLPMKLFSTISDAPQYQEDLFLLRKKTSDFAEKAGKAISEDDRFGRYICCGIGANLNTWLRVSPKLMWIDYRAVLSADNYNSFAAWNGISNIRRLTTDLWTYIKDNLVEWIKRHSDTCGISLIRLLTIGAIDMEPTPERQNIVNICANLSPQAAAGCLRTLTKWMGTLSYADQQSELSEWLYPLLPSFAEQPQFQACASVVASWLESDSPLRKCALEILLEHYDEECQEVRYSRVNLMQLGLEGDSMAKILIFFFKNTNAYSLQRMHIQEKLKPFDPSAISHELFSALRDQVLRRQLDLPAGWDHL